MMPVQHREQDLNRRFAQMRADRKARFICGHPRKSAVNALLVASAILAAPASAQRSGRQASEPIGTIEPVWNPVRDGCFVVTASEVSTVLKVLADSAGRSLSRSASIVYAGVRG